LKNLYLLKYNNYYNRIFKRETTLTNYLNNEYQVFGNINFNPRDGINTEQVINFAVGSADFNADYLVVADDDDNIISRWFVMENFWNRKNQLVLSLRRDLLVDFYDDYKNEPFFCEKGLVDYADNFIYNAENMNFNQILQSSTPLKDTNSTCRWVVCYFAEGLTSTLEYGEQGPEESITIYINGEECSISPNGAHS
jgi:hypothetical protein